MGREQSNIKDLGANIKVYLREEGEKHVISYTTIFEIPGVLVHVPLIF